MSPGTQVPANWLSWGFEKEHSPAAPQFHPREAHAGPSTPKLHENKSGFVSSRQVHSHL